MLRLAFLSFFVAIAAAAFHSPPPLLGCAAAPRDGEWVNIHEEAAFIIWDAKTQTEHFIRRASFDANATDFGFLVPTPSQPELGEAEDGLFRMLSHVTRPPIKVVEKHIPGLPPQPKNPGVTSAAPRSAVEVLEQTTVAGLDAAVLKAEDPAALEEWLTEHGYAFRPALREWLKEYTDNKWIITAFKISGGGRPVGSPNGVAMKSVRMSFKTEQPFYPYREPEDMRDGSKIRPGQARTLRVFLLASERMQGALGADPQSQQEWPAYTVWSDRVRKQDYPNLLQHVKFSESQPFTGLDETEYGWLTEFEDYSSPRPGTAELYFSKNETQTTVARHPIVREQIIYDGIALPAGSDVPLSLQPAPVWWKTLGGLMLLGGLVVAGVIIACVWPMGRKSDAK